MLRISKGVRRGVASRIRAAGRGASAGLVGLVAMALWPSAAGAAPPQQTDVSATVSQCVAAHAEVQELRKKHLLLQAREALKGCMSPQCPALVQNDCYTWSDEIDRETPSVIFNVTSRTVQLVDAHVFVDGATSAIQNNGTPLRLDPGRHTFRVEHTGYQPISRDFVVFTGQRFFQLNVDMDRSADAKAAGAPPPPPRVETYRPVPTATYVLLGLGFAGAASFAGFGIAGTTAKRNLEQSCSPGCTDRELADVRRKFLAADISMGIGAASLIASGLVYLFRPTKERPLTVSVVPGPTGIFGSLVLEGM